MESEPPYFLAMFDETNPGYDPQLGGRALVRVLPVLPHIPFLFIPRRSHMGI